MGTLNTKYDTAQTKVKSYVLYFTILSPLEGKLLEGRLITDLTNNGTNETQQGGIVLCELETWTHQLSHYVTLRLCKLWAH